MDTWSIGDRVFWPGCTSEGAIVRAGIIEARRGGKFVIIDDSGRRFTKSARVLHATRAAADTIMQRLLRRSP